MDKENVIEKIKGIIAREVNNISDRDIIKDVFPETDAYAIDVQDLLNWQEEILRPLTLLDGKYMIGYRRDNREVNGQQAPASMTEICFPVKTITEDNDITVYLLGTRLEKEEGMIQDKDFILEILTDWYKIFQSVHFYNDLNGRVGGIVINIISYILTGKYLIK